MKHYAVFGAGNIGFGVIEKLASDALVSVFDIKEPEYLAKLMSKNKNVKFSEVNAVDEISVQNAVGSDVFDAAILTIGISSKFTAFEDFEDFKRTIEVNFFGNIVPIRVLVRNKLIKNKIIVIASTSGHFAGILPNAYAPSKWMLVNACNSIRTELEEQGISLDLINPRTIKNVRSDNFKSNKGINVSKVVKTIFGALGGGGTRDYFIPSSYSFFHVIELLSPCLFDATQHLPPNFIRKRHYKGRSCDNVALITGASSGLGKELVKLYAEQYKRIYVTARNLEALESLKRDISSKCEIIPIQVDFEDAEAVHIIQNVIAEHKLDLLVNNAGHQVRGSLLDVELEKIRNTMQVNFFSPIKLIATFPNTATIVNILSTTAIAGRRNLGVYSSTKAGLWCFSKALRRTVGRTINVIDVIPATFKSSLTSKGDNVVKSSEYNIAKTNTVKTVLQIRNDNNRLFSSSKDGLTSLDVAKMVKAGIDKKRDTIYVPKIKTRMFILLEAIAPKIFRKLFK